MVRTSQVSFLREVAGCEARKDDAASFLLDHELRFLERIRVICGELLDGVNRRCVRRISPALFVFPVGHCIFSRELGDVMARTEFRAKSPCRCPPDLFDANANSSPLLMDKMLPITLSFHILFGMYSSILRANELRGKSFEGPAIAKKPAYFVFRVTT